jgi:hypothetical protein
MTSNELTCSAKTMTPITIPLARIAEVAATGRTLTVVMNDASTLRLPCRLAEDPLADHPALAAELNTKLRSLRAASSDYRGVRVALDERTEEGDISPESVEERTSRKQ